MKNRRLSKTSGFERVAQSVEHLTFNQGVLGSSPSALTNKIRYLKNLMVEIKCLGGHMVSKSVAQHTL